MGETLNLIAKKLNDIFQRFTKSTTTIYYPTLQLNLQQDTSI